MLDPTGTNCEDKCIAAGNKQNVMFTGFRLRPANKSTSPGVLDSGTGMISDTDTLALIASVGGIAASAAQGVTSAMMQAAESLTDAERSQGLTDAVNSVLGTIDGAMMKQKSVKIWISVMGQCCEEESCCIFAKRLDWQDHPFWFRCDVGNSGPNAGAGIASFSSTDVSGIANAVSDCTRKAIAGFDCSKGSNADPVK
ncbi:hypothetical protein [Neorhodopirellula pilleata]|nr:hypothetical protein [Neorhodopirellula pilleata]